MAQDASCAPVVPDARVAIEEMVGCLATLEAPAPNAEDPLPATGSPLWSSNSDELAELAEYTNASRLPVAPPADAKGMVFIGPQQRARFDGLVAQGARPDVAYARATLAPVNRTAGAWPTAVDLEQDAEMGRQARGVLRLRARRGLAGSDSRELADWAEYSNAARLPDTPPSDEAGMVFLGPQHRARFDARMAGSKGRADVAYSQSTLAPVHATGWPDATSRAQYVEMGLQAQYILYEQARDKARQEFDRAERTLYENVLASGLEASVNTLMVYINDNSAAMQEAPLVFRDPPDIPSILEAAGASVVPLIDSIRGLITKTTRPVQRERALVRDMRNFVIAINRILEARARGNARS